MIDAVTERDLIVTYDPDRDEEAPWAPWKQPLSYDVSQLFRRPCLVARSP